MVQNRRQAVPIEVRRERFNFDDVVEPWFFHGNPIMSATLAAVSATFPPGEAFFIRSVRACMEGIDDATLLEEVRHFAGQEGQHAGQHRAINAAFDRLGFAATAHSEAFEREILTRSANRTPMEKLAGTVVMEHITASLAHTVLTEPHLFEGLPESFRELFLWHAIEEIEHKSVAFDVFIQAGGDPKLLRAALVLQIVQFGADVLRMRRRMLADLNYTLRLQDVVESARYLLGRRGLIRKSVPQLAAMFRSGFHPWDIDDAELIETWKQRRRTAVTGEYAQAGC